VFGDPVVQLARPGAGRAEALLGALACRLADVDRILELPTVQRNEASVGCVIAIVVEGLDPGPGEGGRRRHWEERLFKQFHG